MKPNKIRLLANATATLSMVFAFIACPLELRAAERIYTAYFSPAPGASAVIWVAKEARLFDKYGLDVAPVLIPSSVRTLQAILAGESAIAESAGPAAVSARLARRRHCRDRGERQYSYLLFCHRAGDQARR